MAMDAGEWDGIVRRTDEAAETARRGPPWDLDAAEKDRAALVAEVKRLRTALNRVDAGMDHAADCMIELGRCNCPIADVREALGLPPETKPTFDRSVTQ
jgi:hypothetical protein